MMRKFLMACAVLAGLGAAGFYGYRTIKERQSAAKPAEAVIMAPAITVFKVTAADFVETAMVSGSIVPREEIMVSPELEGFRVLELFAEEGSQVKKGQVLARLVDNQLQAQVAQNEAGVARAQAAIAQAKSQVTEAEARTREADAQLVRAEPLKKSGYLSGAVYDQRLSAAQTSRAQLAAARDAMTAAEAEKTQVQAQRRELDWKLGNTEVKAPADGIVSRRNARIGAMASGAGEPMFRIIQNGDVELDAEMVETELSRVKEGQKAVVIIPGVDEAKGTVRLVSTEVDKTTRLGRVRILIGQKPEFRVGAFARGRIETATSHGLAAATSAVTFDPAGAYVQRVVGDKIEKAEVKAGLIMGDKVEILSGLKDGDVIVARAGTFLRDGDVVRPIVPDAKVSDAKVSEAK